MPHTIARIGEVPIRRVFHERDPLIGGPCPELLPPDVEQRPDDRAVAGIDACQPARPGAPQQPQQHRFRLIVPRVPHRHAIGPEHAPATLQGGISKPPRGLFDRAALRGRDTTDVHALHMGRNVHPVRQGCGELLITLRFRPPQLVIHVHQADNGELASGRELQEDREQRDRIGAAGHRYRDARTPRQQVISPDRAPDALDQAHRVLWEQGGGAGRVGVLLAPGRYGAGAGT